MSDVQKVTSYLSGMSDEWSDREDNRDQPRNVPGVWLVERRLECQKQE